MATHPMQMPLHRRAVSWAIRLFSLTLATAPVAFGQAWVELDTPSGRLITNRINGVVIDSINYYAEVLHGPASATDAGLIPVTPLFRPPGRVNALRPGALGNYKVGDRIRFLVRAWNHEGNRYQRFEDAVIRGSSTSWLSEPVKSVSTDPFPLSIKLDGMPVFSVGIQVPASEIGTAIIPVGPNLPSSFGSGATVTFHGITGDGRAAFYRKEAFFGLPAGYATATSHELAESISLPVREFARQDTFYSFQDPNFPPIEPTITPAWSVPAMTSDGSMAIGNRQSGSVSNVFLIRGTELVPLPLKSGLGLSGNGNFAFGTVEDGSLVRHRLQLSFSELLLLPPPAGRLFRIIASSETGNACLIGTRSVSGELMQYWHAWEGLKPLPPTNVFLPVCLSPDGSMLAGSMRTNGHRVAARWTVARGLERIGPLDRESNMGGLSFDGTLLAGETWFSDSPANTDPILWTNDGTSYRIRDLVPRLNPAFVDTRNVFGMSHDGRAIALHNGAVAHIVRFRLPGERIGVDFRLAHASARPLLGFHAQMGVGYTIERRLPDGTWTTASPETEGLDAWRSWTPNTDSDHGLFRVTARSL